MHADMHVTVTTDLAGKVLRREWRIAGMAVPAKCYELAEQRRKEWKLAYVIETKSMYNTRRKVRIGGQATLAPADLAEALGFRV